MCKYLKTLAIASALAAGLVATPALYAHDSNGSSDSMMGQGGMMMNMMGQMSEMMKNCNKMMQSMKHDGSGEADEQWRKDAPETDEMPERNG